jgi:hypothetical protein
MRFRDLLEDERAIEGLPVRLVIAFVVGLASLSVMLNMLSGLGGLAASELDAQLGDGDDVISTSEQQIEVTVVDAEGKPVSGATVLVEGDTARLASGDLRYGKTGPDGTVTLSVDPELARGQSEGRLTIDIKPPSGSGHRDRQDNAYVLVVDE